MKQTDEIDITGGECTLQNESSEIQFVDHIQQLWLNSTFNNLPESHR